jgi:hypothetical protein
MRADDERLEAAVKAVLERVGKFNELMLATIKGHLFIEQQLDAYLDVSVAEPAHLPERMRFADKVRLCRALSYSQSEDQFWTVIGCVNGLRNAIAHGHSEEKIAKAKGTLKAEYLVCFTPERREELKDLPEHQLVEGACLDCAGFLVVLTDDAKERAKRLEKAE